MNYTQLKVGDKVPDLTLKNLINYPTKTAKISDFKGKVIILDFWATWCTSCISSFPKMELLKQKFGEQIQIVLVNFKESETKGTNFLERRKKLANLNITLPILYGDTALFTLFKFETVPHFVWIDPQGVYRSRTYSSDVNSENIQEFLINSEAKMIQKKEDVSIQLEMRPPLLPGQNAENILNQSMLLRDIEGLPRFNSTLRSNDKRGYSFIYSHASIVELYQFAYGYIFGKSILPITKSRTSLNLIDSICYTRNLYIYQLIYPSSVVEQKMQKTMRDDLDRYFGLTVRFKQQKIQALVLSSVDTSLLIYTSGAFQIEISDVDFKLNNLTIKELLLYLNGNSKSHEYLAKFHIIDETGFKGKLGRIDIETDVSDYKALDKALQNYGLRLKLEEREVQMMVLSEPDGYVFPCK